MASTASPIVLERNHSGPNLAPRLSGGRPVLATLVTSCLSRAVQDGSRHRPATTCRSPRHRKCSPVLCTRRRSTDPRRPVAARPSPPSPHRPPRTAADAVAKNHSFFVGGAHGELLSRRTECLSLKRNFIILSSVSENEFVLICHEPAHAIFCYAVNAIGRLIALAE
jgi:hypothetical protein